MEWAENNWFMQLPFSKETLAFEKSNHCEESWQKVYCQGAFGNLVVYLENKKERERGIAVGK
jgi:hypothetical protein